MKLKIVNRKKFIRSLVVVIGLLLLLLLGLNNAYSKTEITYKEEYILKGDTLWTIAKREVENNTYYQNKDIRKVIYEIKEINKIENENLVIGQKILIPYI